MSVEDKELELLIEEDEIHKIVQEPLPLTDAGNAERLVRAYGDDIRYNHPDRQWWIWNGKHWEEDKCGRVNRWALQTVRRITTEVDRNSDSYGIFRGFEAASEAKNSIVAMLAMAQSLVPVLRQDFDKHVHLLNVANGTLNLKTQELQPHSREDFLSRMTDVEFDPFATCPRFEQFICEITASDAALAALLQTITGYALWGENCEERAFIFKGKGANGKTKLVEITLEVFGPYAKKAAFDTFIDHRKNNGQARGDIARLNRTRLVVATESNRGEKLDLGIVKELTGGDTITARFLYQGEFEFRPRFSMWLVTNFEPKIDASDDAAWRRIRIVPFDVVIPAAQRDPQLSEKLSAERSGVLNWMLAGLDAYNKHGIPENLKVVTATAAYREQQDTLSHFLDDTCDLQPLGKADRKSLYSKFTAWCESNGERPWKAATFYSALEERGFKTKRGADDRRYVQGLMLKGMGDDL